MKSVKKSTAERTCHQRQYDRRVNKRHMQTQESKVDMGKALDAGLVVTESSSAKDAYSKPINDKEPMAEVHLTVEHNVLDNEQQHAKQPEFNNEGRVDQDAEQCQVKGEARKTTQERNRNLKPREIPSAKTHHTPNACKPNPRSNNQTSRNWAASKSSDVMSKVMQKAYHSRNPGSFSDSKHFVCSTFQKCVFNANNDACVIKFLKELNSRVKVQSPKTRNSNKPIKQKSYTQTHVRQIFTRHRFPPNQSSVVHEKSSPRSCLRCKPTCRIFKTLGLRWISTGKLFASSITKVDSETPHDSNADISNPHECIQTLDISASTLNLDTESSFLNTLCSTTNNDWDILYQLMFDEYFNPPPSVVSPVPAVAALRPADPTGSPSSTSIDQDAPSTSTSSTTHET
ncbi:hypothetical protein Tco_0319108 [Tanacetum coccineum]